MYEKNERFINDKEISFKNLTYSLTYYKNNHIYYGIEKSEGKINIENIFLKGKHNISNIMASIAPAVLMNISKKDIEKSIRNFKPLNHRVEYLGYVKKIRCFNDSKSTNPEATIAAINDFNKEITLIMGGKDKDMDFSRVVAVLNKKVNRTIRTPRELFSHHLIFM